MLCDKSGIITLRKEVDAMDAERKAADRLPMCQEGRLLGGRLW